MKTCQVKIGSRILGLLAVVTFALPIAASQKLTLAWDRSVDASVTGYKLYYREAAATNYTQVDVGNTNVLTLTGLSETRTYTFYVTCYNAAGLGSDPSNAVGYSVPLAPLSPVVTRNVAGQPIMMLHAEAVPGRQVVLQTSTDLVGWTTFVTSAVGHPIDHVVDNITTEEKRFFRTSLVAN